MGLAASQARLLTITARLADNELRSQTINNAKMRLATESSQASENYISALNNATLKFSNYALDGEALNQNLTFNALTAYSSYNTQYGLINSSGQLLVSEAEARIFEQSGENLDQYLLLHGLKYDTTYFDEIGAMKAENVIDESTGAILTYGYVAPFDVVEPQELKEYFKNYNSYETSIEVEKYNNAYGKYVSAEGALINASQKIMQEYFTSTTNTPKITGSGSNYTMALDKNDTLATKIQIIKDAFRNSNNNYSYNNTLLSTILNASTPDNPPLMNDINAILEGITATGDGYTKTEEVQIQKIDVNTYILDNTVKITVDSDKTELPVLTAELLDKSTGTTLTDGDKASLKNYINELEIKHTDGSETTIEKYTYQDINKAKRTIVVTGVSKEDGTAIANELVNEIINTILSEAPKDFAEFLYSDANNLQPLRNAGVAIDSNVTGTTRTLEEFYKDYKTAAETYIKTMFEDDGASIAAIKDELDQGTLNYRDLGDVDFVLRYMNEKGYKSSANFITVIKEFMVEELIKQNGTPKYAWVDMNDKNNEDNPDVKAQWYTNLFNRMMQGYKALENGLASSAQWIEYALESGIVTMEQVDGSYKWQGLDYKACARITEDTDQTAVAKAEAQYTRAMNDIEAKDHIYDLELKNIDTEHSALQTEYDSIKNVISKNVERTFNFYKNA